VNRNALPLNQLRRAPHRRVAAVPHQNCRVGLLHEEPVAALLRTDWEAAEVGYECCQGEVAFGARTGGSTREARNRGQK
jgi:hypothetical protein